MTKKTRRAKARRALLTLSLVLVSMMVAVGGTIAFLTAESGMVTNTFTLGNITLTLKEHKYDPATNKVNSTEVDGNDNYKLVPGSYLTKDPFIKVGEGSEPCWVFVEITKDPWNDKLTYDTATGWTKVDVANREVYGYKVAAAEINEEIYLLKDNKVNVAEDLTTVTGTPTMTLQGYAIQLMKDNTTEFTMAQAWEALKK